MKRIVSLKINEKQVDRKQEIKGNLKTYNVKVESKYNAHNWKHRMLYKIEETI